MRYTLLFLFSLFFSLSTYADDSIWVLKKAFVETYHLNKNCPVILGKKVKAYSLSDETDARSKMRQAIQLADPCKVCKTPDIRRTRDNRLDEVIAEALGMSYSMDYDDDEEDGEGNDSVSNEMPFNELSYFDDEVIIGLPENGKVTSSVYKKRGVRFKMFEVKRAMEERLIGASVTCEVVSSRKSNFFGAEGQLVVRPLYISTEDGTIIRTKHDDIVIRGKNRQNIKAVTIPFIAGLFIPGQGAKVRPTDEFVITLDPTSDSSANGMVMREKAKAEEDAKAKDRLRASLGLGTSESTTE